MLDTTTNTVRRAISDEELRDDVRRQRRWEAEAWLRATIVNDTTDLPADHRQILVAAAAILGHHRPPKPRWSCWSIELPDRPSADAVEAAITTALDLSARRVEVTT